MERLRNIEESLIASVQGQMGDLSRVDAKELGEVVDMIKDIEEAIYYCTITEAMEGKSYYRMPDWERDMEKGKMYYSEREIHPITRDMREGRSPISRKMYMEAKELHHDKPVKMKELEHYLNELSKDIVEMIEDASPEEKQMLNQKLTTLAGKI